MSTVENRKFLFYFLLAPAFFSDLVLITFTGSSLGASVVTYLLHISNSSSVVKLSEFILISFNFEVSANENVRVLLIKSSNFSYHSIPCTDGIKENITVDGDRLHTISVLMAQLGLLFDTFGVDK